MDLPTGSGNPDQATLPQRTDPHEQLEALYGRQHREPCEVFRSRCCHPHVRTTRRYRSGWMSTATCSPDVKWAMISFSWLLRGRS